jgi:restriction system protein
MKELFHHNYDDFFNPTLVAKHKLGGSGSIEEIEEKVAIILKLLLVIIL